MKKLAVVALAAACGGGSGGLLDGSVNPDAPGAGYPEVALVTTSTNKKLDLLLVIDDSPSMVDKQNNLKNNMPNLINELQAGPFPDLQVGVISTDMGTTGEDTAMAGDDVGMGPGACSGAGKGGNLTVNGSVAITGKYLYDTGTVRNYAGTLSDRLGELVSLGASGCGFEQPLHALSRALDPSNTNNAGFLRADARLGILVLTDEDDCSVKTPSLMSADTATFGPLGSFRCTRFGVTCDGAGATPDAMNEIGPKTSCHSNETSQYVTDVARYKTLLAGLKSDPRAIAFGSIQADTTPFSVELRAAPGGGTAIPALGHSCTYVGLGNNTEVGDPGVRIAELAASVPRGTTYPVCQLDLSGALTDFGVRLSTLVGGMCIAQPIAEPVRCEAFDINSSGSLTPLDACDASQTAPCFEIVDNTMCPSQKAVHIVRAAPVTDDTWTSVRCAQ